MVKACPAAISAVCSATYAPSAPFPAPRRGYTCCLLLYPVPFGISLRRARRCAIKKLGLRQKTVSLFFLCRAGGTPALHALLRPRSSRNHGAACCVQPQPFPTVAEWPSTESRKWRDFLQFFQSKNPRSSLCAATGAFFCFWSRWSNRRAFSFYLSTDTASAMVFS